MPGLFLCAGLRHAGGMNYLRAPLIALLGACLLAVVYWPGLHGPLLLDDTENLAPLSRYLAHQLSAAGVIFGNHSGVLGRPVSMASFVLDAWLWGDQTFGFKLTNLLLHLGNAALVWALLSRLLRRDPALAGLRWLPAWLALIWAALPIQVSTVLYIVQRMALLSALLTLLGLLAYVRGREWIESGHHRRGLAFIWLLFPFVTILAMLAKENGVLAIAFAAVIEFVWFGRATPRPRMVTALFALALAAPVLGGLAMVALEPQRLLAGYSSRSFTLWQRVLTEPRILWDYISAILIPNGPRLGLFHDDYPASTGLFSPLSTIVAIAAWLITIVAGLALRVRAPAVAFGVGFFLAAHALESSVLPLELYFEHRNYLASLGILIAIAGLAALVIRRLPASSTAMRKASLLLLALVPATYLTATLGRASVWGSESTLYAQEEAHNPHSARLNAILAARAMERGELASALRYLGIAERNDPARERMTATVRRMLAYCASGQTIPQALYLQAEQGVTRPLTQYGMVAWEALAQRAETGQCPADRPRLAAIGIAWAQRSGESPTSHWAWRTRYNSARLLAASGQMRDAETLAKRAFVDSGNNFGVGVLAFQTCASTGDIRHCAGIAGTLHDRANPEDRQAIMAADAFVKASRQPPAK